MRAAPPRHAALARRSLSEHAFRLEPLGGSGVHFTQAERFAGVLVPLFGKALDQTRLGFTEMNEALKRRAEAAA